MPLNNIPLKYSTEIIQNRPDYISREANIKRIGFDVKAVRREFFQRFIIFGQIGLNAYHLDSLFNSVSQMFSAGILPSIDLFTGGRKIAMLKLKKFEYEEALNDYQKTILDGIKEMNTAILQYNEAVQNYLQSKNRLDMQKKTYSLALDKRDIGASGDLEVLYARQAYLAVKKEEVSNKINSVIATIGMYKASGGADLYKIDENI